MNTDNIFCVYYEYDLCTMFYYLYFLRDKYYVRFEMDHESNIVAVRQRHDDDGSYLSILRDSNRYNILPAEAVLHLILGL